MPPHEYLTSDAWQNGLIDSHTNVNTRNSATALTSARKSAHHGLLYLLSQLTRCVNVCAFLRFVVMEIGAATMTHTYPIQRNSMLVVRATDALRHKNTTSSSTSSTCVCVFVCAKTTSLAFREATSQKLVFAHATRTRRLSRREYYMVELFTYIRVP